MRSLFQVFRKFKLNYLEAIIWIAALLVLSLTSIQEGHYSLCVFNNLGLSFCPGCGLGRSVNYFFQAKFEASFHAHPFGIPAVIILLIRIFIIFKQNIKYKLN